MAMPNVPDYNLESPEALFYGNCEFCGASIYKGDTVYSSCDFEVCEDCGVDFLRKYKRVAQ